MIKKRFKFNEWNVSYHTANYCEVLRLAAPETPLLMEPFNGVLFAFDALPDCAVLVAVPIFPLDDFGVDCLIPICFKIYALKSFIWCLLVIVCCYKACEIKLAEFAAFFAVAVAGRLGKPRGIKLWWGFVFLEPTTAPDTFLVDLFVLSIVCCWCNSN